MGPGGGEGVEDQNNGDKSEPMVYSTINTRFLPHLSPSFFRCGHSITGFKLAPSFLLCSILSTVLGVAGIGVVIVVIFLPSFLIIRGFWDS